MNSIQKIDNDSAYHRYIRIKQLKQHSEEMLLLIGAELYIFLEEKQYEAMGYDTFEVFLGDPEIDISPRTASRMIRIYKIYVLGHIEHMHLETENKVEALIEKDPDYIRLLVATGVSKLDIISPYVNEHNKERLLNMGSTLSRSDLVSELTGEVKMIESWTTWLAEARTLCGRLAQSSAPLEVREFANEFVNQTKLIQEIQSIL